MYKFVKGFTAGCLMSVAFAGCSSRTPFDATDAGPYENEGVYTQDANTPEWPQGPRNPLTQPSANSPVEMLSQAGNAIVDAITPEAQVISTDDPTSLSSPATVDSELHYRAARLAETQNNFQRSVGHYQQALQMDPSDVRSLLGLARLFDRQSNLAQAEQLYLQAVEMQPHNPSTLNDLALCLARQSKLEPAMATLQQAVELAPDNQRYRNNLATVMVEMGQPEDAFRALAEVYAPAVAHYNTAFLMSRRGQVQGAVDQLTAALQADPYFEPAQALLEQLQPRGGLRQAQVIRRLPPVI